MTVPRAPNHLSTEAKRWWRALAVEYGIQDEAGKLLLATALEAFDRLRRCQALIAEEGELVRDRFDQLKPHPLLASERDARSQLLMAIKSLNFDTEPAVVPKRRP